ncbi:Crp/Fnr family transcriptional regulator [Cytobacillus sp. Hm23]
MYVQMLRKINIFQDLPEQSLAFISENLKSQYFNKGEIIFSEVEEATAVFFVKSGIVRLTKGDQNGKEIVVCLKKAGDIFAEAALFSEEGTRYPATSQMLQEGEVLYLDTNHLQVELMQNPDIAVEMIRYMSRQLRSFTSIIRDIALLDVYSKTISTLDRLAKDFGIKKSKGVQIELPLTVQEFANIIGATRESVSRVFSKLKSERMIDIEEKKIIICDWNQFSTMYKH